MTLLDKLERRFGRFAIPNLMRWIVSGQAVVFLVTMLVNQNFAFLLTMSRYNILRGQVWRLVTFLFVPDSFDLLGFLISAYLYYWIGTALERYWGAARFTIFIAVTVLGGILAGMLTGYASNQGLFLGLFLAFALLNPEARVLLLFIIPVKIKWLGMLSAALWLFALITASWPGKVQLIFEMSALWLFFGPDMLAGVKAWYRREKWRRKNQDYWNNGRR